MNVKSAIIAAQYVVAENLRTFPNREICVGGKEYVKVNEVNSALQDLILWVYPDLESDRLKQIIPCSQCNHYRKLRSKANPRKVKFICKLDGAVKRSDFYCGNAIEKEK